MSVAFAISSISQFGFKISLELNISVNSGTVASPCLHRWVVVREPRPSRVWSRVPVPGSGAKAHLPIPTPSCLQQCCRTAWNSVACNRIRADLPGSPAQIPQVFIFNQFAIKAANGHSRICASKAFTCRHCRTVCGCSPWCGWPRPISAAMT